eukprot:gene19423-23258_t
MANEPGGLGWFQETLTLDEPYVPVVPEPKEWFNADVLAAARASSAAPNTVTVLLTGRTTLYDHIIRRIAKSVDLEFHHFGLKPPTAAATARETTFAFKTRFLDALLAKYPAARTLNIYEDRIKHVEHFREYLAKNVAKVSGQVVYVQEPPRYLDEAAELELVNALVAKNGTDAYRLKKSVSYTAAVLDAASHARVLSWFNLPADWEIKCHHQTLNLNAHNPGLWRLTGEQTLESVAAQFPIGTQVSLTVDAIGLSGAALALRVTGVPTANQIAHITVAHHPRAKPVESNQITQWTPLSELVEAGLVSPVIPKVEPVVAAAPVEGAAPVPASPAKKVVVPFEYPIANISLNNHNTLVATGSDAIVLTATIKEVGLIMYESTAPPKSAAAKTQLPIHDILRKHHPTVDKQVMGKKVSEVKTWMSQKKCDDLALIEEYIKNLTL